MMETQRKIDTDLVDEAMTVDPLEVTAWTFTVNGEIIAEAIR